MLTIFVLKHIFIFSTYKRKRSFCWRKACYNEI